MSALTLQNIDKVYGKTQVMHDVSLDIEQGEFVVFVGPSGCGKSTLLRMIAGLESISAGTLFIGDKKMNNVPASKRGIAMVFQSYALYPHMSVADNMGFSLSIAKTPKQEIKQRVAAAAEILQLTPYLNRLPKALSGGQRQRVAIGRAIVREPDVFLFDEPLSNLDAELRVSTRREIANLKASMPDTTMIYVTHDQVEAMTLADKIVVLRDGRVEQVGTPLELYDRPRNSFVGQFIGSPKMNIFGSGDLAVQNWPHHNTGIRPEHLEPATPKTAIVSGTLEFVEKLGEYSLAYLRTATGCEFTVKFDRSINHAIGKELHFKADHNNLHQFDSKTMLRVD
ncbi:ABC transporter ATP-binding protein [Amylibacter kogurei]|uniref:ABC transporter ATP-binding protein n=1 Tax=Paramylibacter kogurei TaxID=1889778 RepID=A0A2G5K875_9RHOB|nr:sn-glycerol-3-phosphate ABC transporter ATP-binding protein UgpC [Amylibacter kogurei]PIB25223.1 ABC transporter ATP-binding protein [Amylibacter kogurei]